MRTPKFLASALIALTFAATTFAQTADEIVDKHIAAIGGLEKWKNVKSMEVKMKTSVQGMDIPITQTKVEGVGMRMDVNVMGTSMITVITPTSGWMNRPAMMGGTGEPEDLPADQLKEQSSQLALGDALLTAKLNGSAIEVISKEKIDGADSYKLKITPKGGNSYNAVVSATSYQLLRITVSQGGQDGEITYSNFKEVDGLTLPFTMEMPNPMTGMMTMETDSVKINPAVDKAIFDKPKK